MNKFILLLLITISSRTAFSQASCDSAQTMCNNFTYSTSTPTNGGQSTQYGCLASIVEPHWISLHTTSSGTLIINIQASYDVDFIAWGPFQSLNGACNNLTDSTQVPDDGINNGCSFSGSASETLIISNAQPNQFYILLVSNFSNVLQPVNLIQSGNAQLTCSSFGFINVGSSADTICAMDSVSLTANPFVQSTSNLTYSLEPGGNISNTPTFIISPTASTTYTLYCTGTNNQNVAQTLSSTINIHVNPVPALLVQTTPTTICDGQYATLTFAGAMNYTISTGVITDNYSPSIVLAPHITTEYTVTGSNSDGCESNEIVTQYVSLCENISSVSMDAYFKLYPNPGDGFYTLETSSKTILVVRNFLGEIVLTKECLPGFSYLDLHAMQNGIYFVTAMQTNKKNIFKLIQQ